MLAQNEATGTTALFPKDFGNLIQQLLLHMNQNFEDCVKHAVKLAVAELKSNIPHHKEEEIEAGFLTRSETAKFLSLSFPTLSRYQKAGLLPYHKVGRKVYFNRIDLINATKVNPKMKVAKS